MKRTSFMAFCLFAALLMCGCGSPKGGKLIFRANGEDFVRQGFTDKNGWSISFENVYVNLSGICAYNLDEGMRKTLPGEYRVDLAAGGPDAEPVLVAGADGVKPGNYQSLKFRLKRASSGEYRGYSIVLTGTASKNGNSVPFTIKFDEEMTFDGREGFVGEEIKGLLADNGSADVEMTFHFDHIFGDIHAPADSHISTGSVGFAFFNRFSRDGRVDVTQQELKEEPEYPALIRAMGSLGHLGEGHCDVSGQSTKL